MLYDKYASKFLGMCVRYAKDKLEAEDIDISDQISQPDHGKKKQKRISSQKINHILCSRRIFPFLFSSVQNKMSRHLQLSSFIGVFVKLHK